MYSLEIDKILSRNEVTKKYYSGCFPCDRIPRLKVFPHCMIVNTDPEGCQGSHWIAIYVPSFHTAEYYDSLGDWPAPSHIHEFLSLFKTVVFNPIALQSDRASTCGMHAIYFLHNRCSGLSLEGMLRKFKLLKCSPDIVVRSFARSLMKV